jgi:nucleotide-binding universal stress UspA family protein
MIGLRSTALLRLHGGAAEQEVMKILLAIDDSKFSEAAANTLAGQFRPQDTEVRVLHVVEPIVISEAPQMSAGYYPELENQLPQAREVVERVAKTLSSAGFRVTTSVATGDARSLILEDAAAWHADLIILGSHGRKGLGRFLLGSVSEAVARHARCSVQIVRIPS